MKYLADVLTFFRLPAAFAVWALIMLNHWVAAMVVFILAILSDAFDGIFARKWTPDERWYRVNAHDFDNLGDSLMFFGALLGLVFRGPTVWMYIMIGSVFGTAFIVFLINKLRPSRAERLDVFFGWCFGTLLFAMLVQITYVALAGTALYVLLGAYVIATAWIVYAKWDRMTSRPEVVYKGNW